MDPRIKIQDLLNLKPTYYNPGNPVHALRFFKENGAYLLTGCSGSGKKYLVCTLIKEYQKQGVLPSKEELDAIYAKGEMPNIYLSMSEGRYRSFNDLGIREFNTGSIQRIKEFLERFPPTSLEDRTSTPAGVLIIDEPDYRIDEDWGALREENFWSHLSFSASQRNVLVIFVAIHFDFEKFPIWEFRNGANVALHGFNMHRLAIEFGLSNESERLTGAPRCSFIFKDEDLS